MLTGSCLCERVTYQITALPTDCSACYCSICRKLTGSMMGAYGAVLKTDFKWVSGEEVIRRFTNKPQSHRLFCSNCGSCLLSHHELAPKHYFLSLGCLNSTDSLDISYQQFTASKAHWAKLDPDIPSHDHQPPGLKDKYTGDEN